jgi:hypothetical protein
VSAVLGDTTVVVQQSEGVWHAAWRRFGRTEHRDLVGRRSVAA